MMQLTEQQKKEGWRIVKFGEIAKSVSKRVLPGDTDLEVYVGLEHLDPDNLRITRRGVPSDVTGQKLRVRPGQIIFGKRRAYQRKVAVADFDGICSAHAMVLEAIPKAVLPEYLPFFMQSDMFMERAVAISEGSLSPTIKWKTLANQEFPLPPRPRQEEMLEVFRSQTQALDICLSAIEKLNLLEKTVQYDVFERRKDHSFKSYKLGNISNIVRGSSPRPKGDKRFYGGNIPRVMVEDIMRDEFMITPCVDFLTEEGALKSRPVPKGTLIIICSGGRTNVGMPGILSVDACIHDGIIAIKDFDDYALPEFLYFYIKSKQRTFDRYATHGGTFVNLTTSIVKSLEIQLPPLERQAEILSSLKSIVAQSDRLTISKKKLINLQSKIIINFLSGGQYDRI